MSKKYRFLVLLLGTVVAAASCSSIFEEKSEDVFSEAEATGPFGKADSLVFDDPFENRALQQRGKYLVRSVAACGVCHGEESSDPSSALSGGREIDDGGGRLFVPNITSDEKTGVGAWTVSELVRVIRTSIDLNGKGLSRSVHRAYRWMSDRDARAISIYLLGSEAVSNEIERRGPSFFSDSAWGVFSRHQEVAGYVPQLQERASSHYGGYLANRVAACSSCHSPDNPDPDEVYSGRDSDDTSEIPSYPFSGPDIRRSSESGLSRWVLKDIELYLESGVTPSGTTVNPEECPWTYFSSMTPLDMQAITLYLNRL